MSKANETQIGGDHYKKHGIYQPWDVLTAWLTPEEYRGWQKGTAIVYLARERDKNGDQDIAKAGHHIQKLVEVLALQSSVDAAADKIAQAFEQQAEERFAGMTREEAFAHAMDECDRAEERAAEIKPQNAFEFLIPHHDKPYSPARAPFVKALWEGFTEKHAAQFKALGITAEHLARAGAELTRPLEQPAPHIDPLKEKVATEQEVKTLEMIKGFKTDIAIAAGFRDLEQLSEWLAGDQIVTALGPNLYMRTRDRIERTLGLLRTLAQVLHIDPLKDKLTPVPPLRPRTIVFFGNQQEADSTFRYTGDTLKPARVGDNSRRNAAYKQIQRFITGKTDTLYVLHDPRTPWSHMKIPSHGVKVLYNERSTAQWGQAEKEQALRDVLLKN